MRVSLHKVLEADRQGQGAYGMVASPDLLDKSVFKTLIIYSFLNPNSQKNCYVQYLFG